MPFFKKDFTVLRLLQLFILYFLMLSVHTNLHASRSDKGINFLNPFMNAAYVRSKTATGSNFSMTVQSLLMMNVSFSRTNIDNESINNAYIGLVLPNIFTFYFNNDDNLLKNLYRTHFIFKTGSGDLGRTSQFGFAYMIASFDDKDHHKILLNYTRETYKDYSQYNNEQFGITYAYLPDF